MGDRLPCRTGQSPGGLHPEQRFPSRERHCNPFPTSPENKKAMTEKEKMLAGELFDPRDAQLAADRDRARRLMHRLNAELCEQDDTYRATLRELCPGVGAAMIRAPFYCDYGYNVFVGEGTFVNFGCVCLDLAPITLGRRCQVGPGVQLLTAHHPLDPAQRATGVESGRPVTVGDDCWIGGGAILCPGVTVGDRAVIGAGSVVTRDVPADCVVAGNPAREIRHLR